MLIQELMMHPSKKSLLRYVKKYMCKYIRISSEQVSKWILLFDPPTSALFALTYICIEKADVLRIST